MTTNRDWLFSLPLEEQYAWMNAEHQDGTLDGDTDALERKSADLIHEYYKPMVSELQAQVYELTVDCDMLENERDNLATDLLRANNERELYREALSQLLDTVTDGMSKVSAILDNYDEGMA